jgi:glucose-6-phosphate isomerase
MVAIREGVKIAYQKADLPYMEVELEGITPYELGAFMQFKMLEMMYLGALMEVNPFNQPNVESYKVETKNLLEAA